mgnify:CR=1 FL=1
MNKTRYKIAALTGSAVMAAMLLSLLILNIVFNKKIELRAENAIKNVFTLDSDEYLNYESENDTGSLYYASLVYMGADSENRDDIYQILTPKEKKLIDWYETHPSDEMQRAKVLLEKLAEYKPLAKIEEMEEQNYNMIDNVLNNGGEKAQREENNKEQEQPVEKASLKLRLAEKKAKLLCNDGKNEVKENIKKSQRELL